MHSFINEISEYQNIWRQKQEKTQKKNQLKTQVENELQMHCKCKEIDPTKDKYKYKIYWGVVIEEIKLAKIKYKVKILF